MRPVASQSFTRTTSPESTRPRMTRSMRAIAFGSPRSRPAVTFGATIPRPARRVTRFASLIASVVPVWRSSSTATKPSSSTTTVPVIANWRTALAIELEPLLIRLFEPIRAAEITRRRLTGFMKAADPGAVSRPTVWLRLRRPEELRHHDLRARALHEPVALELHDQPLEVGVVERTH